MDLKQQQILEARNKVMENRKVLCTGNPDKISTIASGIKQVWPNATFIHLSKGYDFYKLGENEDNLKMLFKTHNTFINASYVNGVQKSLLEMCSKYMTIGDVFNIGSTHEYDGLGSENYKRNKIELREKSLELNSFRFQTCHIVMGGIDTGLPETTNWIKPNKIAEVISWITKQKFKIPIIGIDQPKQPW